jgi:hypothetical protein
MTAPFSALSVVFRRTAVRSGEARAAAGGADTAPLRR